MRISFSSTESDKLIMNNVLMESQELSKYLLETVPFSYSSLSKLLSKYSFIYLKPVKGSLGSGVFSVRTADDLYLLSIGESKLRFNNIKELQKHLKRVINRADYLIQEGWEVMKFQGKHTDLRIIYQRPFDSWDYMGIGVRVAGSTKLAISNYSAGGNVISLYDYLSNNNYNKWHIEHLNLLLKSICKNSIDVIGKYYPNFRKLGFDIGVDKRLNPKIIEVNTAPQFKLFKEIDLDVYNKIKENSKTIKSYRYKHSSLSLGGIIKEVGQMPKNYAPKN